MRHVFSAYGIELEYMIVDCGTLSVLPVADRLLFELAGKIAPEAKCGRLAWANELALHVLELRNVSPEADLSFLSGEFQHEIARINSLLRRMNGMLLPSGAHPWMNPRKEARLWPHEGGRIYQAFDRIFDCRSHGWSNLQSVQLNLPFSGDEEFSRLHDAVRLLLPIMPAIAASSPFAEGRFSGALDFRMQSYAANSARIPSIAGEVIPDPAVGVKHYEETVLAAIYRDIAPHDPEGLLREEWLNSRGAIPRFSRNALEIRVLDMQECPHADLALAALCKRAAEHLYRNLPAPQLSDLRTGDLAAIFRDVLVDAEEAIVADRKYLALLGMAEKSCRAGDIWRHFDEITATDEFFAEAVRHVLNEGPLARRILRALGGDHSTGALFAIYRQLADCLQTGKLFS